MQDTHLLDETGTTAVGGRQDFLSGESILTVLLLFASALGKLLKYKHYTPNSHSAVFRPREDLAAWTHTNTVNTILMSTKSFSMLSLVQVKNVRLIISRSCI